jgi:hypothetical protein
MVDELGAGKAGAPIVTLCVNRGCRALEHAALIDDSRCSHDR